jgi:hypothetical protein
VPSATVIVKRYEPAAVGVPEMRPFENNVRPGGR